MATVGVAGGWQPATTLVDQPSNLRDEIWGPSVAVDSRGDATAAWEYLSDNPSAISEAEWTPGQGWTKPQTLDQDVSGSPSVAVDARGDAVATWTAFTGLDYQTGPTAKVRAAYRPAGKPWGAPQTISPPGDEVVAPYTEPIAVIDGQGRALVGWNVDLTDNGGGLEVVARSQVGAWTTPTVLSDKPDAFSLVMNARGQALAVWQGSEGTEGGLWVDSRSTQGDWSAPREISPDDETLSGSPPPAVNARGEAVIAFWDGATSAPAVAIGSVDGRFGRPQRIGPAPVAAGTVLLAMAQTGATVVTWRASNGCCVYAMSRRAGAHRFGKQRPVFVAQGHESVGIDQVVMDARGDTIALLSEQDQNFREDLYAVRRPTGGSFNKGRDLGEVNVDHTFCFQVPVIANAPNGNAVAVWGASATYSVGATGTDLTDVECHRVEAATFTR
ncbi:MAG TPA: hypothetical protein VEH52_00035 [Gaiellaceae bacterium]|nr:hypothetical protein [Gaiellaceae bacterium]